MQKLKYLSYRVVFLGAAAVVFLASLGILLLYLAVSEKAILIPAILAFVGAGGISAAGWFWIIRPYYRSEKAGNRLMEGFLLSEEDLEMVTLSPSTREQVFMIEKMLRSPQAMDLNKRQAQYLALQNQINPHFLYNTLESIRGEALIEGLDNVADMTEALAKFFRYTITKVENLVSVEEELDNCETYFWIQKYRFGERLQLHIEYDPEEWDELMNCRIPKLTLQPILENSIIHGVEPKIGVGNLRIHFKRTQDRLIICVSDDGIGIEEKTLARLNRNLGKGSDSFIHREEHKGGIALENVNNRIHLIFGDEYGLHVYSIPGGGTDVEISLPIRTSDMETAIRW